MNLVMIGHFKSAQDAEEINKLINQLTTALTDKVEVGKSLNRFSDDVREILNETNCYSLSPSELEHFLYDVHTEVKNDKIILNTDETEISAFFKLMINKGAKVEIFSAHDHPDVEDEFIG